MEHGRIVEQGTHAELLDRDGPYFRLYSSQFVAPAVELDEPGAESDAPPVPTPWREDRGYEVG
jgi:ATP-binding cassette subfamily B protein